MTALQPIRRGIVSVSNTRWVDELVAGVKDIFPDVEIIASAGTGDFLKSKGIKVTGLEDYVGMEPMPEGLLKTLHPEIFGGILLKEDNEEMVQYANEYGMKPIDLVVCNFYPITGCGSMDIGGPAMLAAGAKNNQRVAVLSDPKQYHTFLNILGRYRGTSFSTRQFLANKAINNLVRYMEQTQRALRDR